MFQDINRMVVSADERPEGPPVVERFLSSKCRNCDAFSDTEKTRPHAFVFLK